MVRLWTWEAFAHGAEVVSYFRWRQAPFAQEQMHAGLLRPDDGPAPGLAEAQTVAGELAALPDAGTAAAEVALIFDYPSDWAWSVLPQGADFSYFRLMLDAYRALRRHGLSIDIVPSDCSDLAAYKLVLAPGLAAMPDALRAALAGREALVGPRSGAVTPELTIPRPMGPNLPGLDCTVTRVESLPPGTERPIEGGGSVLHWAETLEGTAEAGMRYVDGTAFSMHADTTTYIGGWPDATLWDRLIADATARCGIATERFPEGLRRRDTATHRFYFNYNPEPCSHGGMTLPPGGVHWVAR
jgi:beta-galactosidase